ncbi:hypothetical protein HQ590_05550, partial [bacterium]|nr:hypothetical protein [bacterium]
MKRQNLFGKRSRFPRSSNRGQNGSLARGGRRLRMEPLEDRRLLSVDPLFGVPQLNVAGQGYSGSNPPDTIGDVGVFHYVQATNDGGGSNVTVYNKADGSVAVPQFNLNTLAAPGMAYVGHGDPVVLYDHLADRWLLVEFTSTSNELEIFISDTGIPTSNPADWTHWELDAPNFPDYFKIAMWPDAYFMGANESDNPAYALDRTAMLAGAGGTLVFGTDWLRATTPDLPNWLTNHIMPADLDGFMTPSAGDPGIFVRHVDDEFTTPGTADPGNDFLELWEMDPNFGAGTFTYTLAATIPIEDFDRLIGVDAGAGSDDVEQPGTANELDSIPHFMMWRLQYRNYGAYETLAANFTVDAGEDGTPDLDGGTATEHAGPRWFELRRLPGGAWDLYQEQTLAPDVGEPDFIHRWMGSAAMNLDGDLALGYSISSSTTFPSIAYSGRRATDPRGTLPDGEHLLIAGTASQTATSRWGDYSAMSVDPVDDGTFWYTQEFIPDDGNWDT